MLKTLNMTLVCSPVGFCEEIIALYDETILQFAPKMTKIPNVSISQRFYAIFARFWTDLVNWNVLKGQQGMNMLSSRLF